MNFFFVIFIPMLIFILNEYFQNKIFICFERFYKYSKIIALFIPFILVYFNPELVKKMLVMFSACVFYIRFLMFSIRVSIGVSIWVSIWFI